MGYVLPLPHHQYKDYHRRVMKVKQDPYFIERPYKAIFETPHQNISREINTSNYEGNYGFRYQVDPINAPDDDRIYAELTGKGRHFSDQV